MFHGDLYKLWNRLASASYVPQAVRAVDIPKPDGGTQPLGIPAVADRIARDKPGMFVHWRLL